MAFKLKFIFRKKLNNIDWRGEKNNEKMNYFNEISIA